MQTESYIIPQKAIIPNKVTPGNEIPRKCKLTSRDYSIKDFFLFLQLGTSLENPLMFTSSSRGLYRKDLRSFSSVLLVWDLVKYGVSIKTLLLLQVTVLQLVLVICLRPDY